MIDFMLSGLRDAAAAKRLFRKALTDPSHPQPRVALLQKSDSIPNALPPDRLGDGQKRLHLPI